jgi:hypothetical protein
LFHPTPSLDTKHTSTCRSDRTVTSNHRLLHLYLFSPYNSRSSRPLSPVLPREVRQRSVNNSGNALGGLADRLKFKRVRKRSPPLDHVDDRTGLKLVPPSLIHSHKPTLYWLDLGSSPVYNNPLPVPHLRPRRWPNEVVQAQPCAMTLRDTGTPWTLVWIYILSMLPTCESLYCISNLSSSCRGFFEADPIDWWERSWGGYFQTFGDFLGIKWEVMGESRLHVLC